MSKKAKLSLEWEVEEDFPECCGAVVLAGLYFTVDGGYKNGNSQLMPWTSRLAELAEHDKIVASAAKEVAVKLARYVTRGRRVDGSRTRVLAVATTVHDPENIECALKERILEEAGMICVRTWINVNSGNTLKMWVAPD